MTVVASESPGEAVTPSDLIAQVRGVRARREAVERDQLSVALSWAVAHEVVGPARADVAPGFPVGPGLDEAVAAQPTEEDVDDLVDRSAWRGLPELTWDSPAPFAAALGMTTRGGRAVLRRALTLVHRMPQTQALWEAGRVESRVAGRVADAVAGQPDDVCAWVDTQVASRVRRHRVIGPVVLDRLVEEALTELHAEEAELKREEELHARYARIGSRDDKPDALGLAEFVIRGDWPDIAAFNATITALAEAIRRSDRADACEPLEVRRSIAVGIIADPAAALALLDPGTTDAEPVPPRQQQVLIAFHLAAQAVSGAGGVTVGRDGAMSMSTADRGSGRRSQSGPGDPTATSPCARSSTAAGARTATATAGLGTPGSPTVRRPSTRNGSRCSTRGACFRTAPPRREDRTATTSSRSIPRILARPRPARAATSHPCADTTTG